MIEKVNKLEKAFLSRFLPMSSPVAADPVPDSPNYIFAEICRLKTVDFGRNEYVLFGRLIAWCQSQGVISRDEADFLSTF